MASKGMMHSRVFRAAAVGAFVVGLVGASLAQDEPVRRAGADTPPAPPSQAFDGFFARVAASGIFPDFKTFVDAVPREAPEKILATYRARPPRSKAALEKFVQQHFVFPQPAATPAPQQGLPIEDHIAALWPVLTRSTPTVPAYSSALPLPEPYVVPGGRFTEMYYWDSYFTMLGLGAKDQTVRDGMVADFAYMVRTYGHVPNGSRTYYLSRSQPPFFFKMVELGGGDAVARYLPELKAEYAYWMKGEDDVARVHAVRNVVAMPDGSILNRYWDERDTPRDEMFPNDVAVAKTSKEPKAILYRNIRAAAESGWDFSSRWFADGKTPGTIETTNIIPVDLNSLLYGLERAIAGGCERTLKSDLRDGIRRPRRTPPRGDEPLSVGPGVRRVLRLRLGRRHAPQYVERRYALSAVRRRSGRHAGACRRRHRAREAFAAWRRCHDREPYRPAMGRTERLGAAAMDRSGWPGALRLVRSGR